MSAVITEIAEVPLSDFAPTEFNVFQVELEAKRDQFVEAFLAVYPGSSDLEIADALRRAYSKEYVDGFNTGFADAENGVKNANLYPYKSKPWIRGYRFGAGQARSAI